MIMFGLELWFFYAVLSAAIAGIYVFTAKVAVERGYEGVLFNTASSAISAVILLVSTGLMVGYEYLSWLALFLVAINAITYMLSSVVRYEALKCIDTAIYYPLYKTVGPIFAIVAGVVIFSETFSDMEWLGLLLSLTVPLLLIGKKEDERQKNLKRGLWLLIVTCFLAAIAAVALKFGADLSTSVYMFAAVTHVVIFMTGIGLMLRKRSVSEIRHATAEAKTKQYFFLVLVSGVMHAASFLLFVLALANGTLSLVYTIQSLYILIPIVLSIIFYNEHWNFRKVIAIILSIVALWFLQ